MKFIDNNGTFRLENADKYTGLYFPLGNEAGLKSVVSPDLGGDAKLDQNHFLLEPVSIEGLHNNKNSRNVWILRDGKMPWSVTGNSVWQQAEGKESTTVTAGPMWHSIERASADGQLETSVLSFVPVEINQEVHVVNIKNVSNEDVELKVVAAIPMYGRSADNLRDHRHVTSLLHRVCVTKKGVVVNPTLSFDERGHQLNDTVYYTYGMTEDGKAPKSFYPIVSEFIGEGGSLEKPYALINGNAEVKEGYTVNGVEALGGLSFEKITLKAFEKKTYIIFSGVENTLEAIEANTNRYASVRDVLKEYEGVKQYWDKKINVSYSTGNPEFDGFMSWVSFQPELRRIFGCSFLPHHDYGKGGRGWRDLWQDCLALLLMNPGSVKSLLLSNFEGVRSDGTNATIIGSNPGEFKADRNGITRVWMDHAFWPLLTTNLYINQTGDLDMLLEETSYYKDRQVMRGTAIDEMWDGVTLREKDSKGEIYKGSVLEHLLLQNLTEYWEVGEHGNLRLRDADWNDAVDMAGKKGESVAFTHGYAGNLETLANLVRELSKKQDSVEILKELMILLDDSEASNATPDSKNAVLNNYSKEVMHGVSCEKCEISLTKLADILEGKASLMREKLRKNEWIEAEGTGFFRGYYDNDGNSLETNVNGKQHMTLTGQVFAIMCNTATEEEVSKITKAADKFLYDANCGGYRLNTDFEEIKTNMGRMFGFAYGEKENGAVFSHMAVMYANALYKRGFAHEGFKALNSLFTQSMDFSKGKIYPGIPEYFGRGGRGLYHYLTGAASWYMLTVVSEMFGVKGTYGELTCEPKLLKEQFDSDHKASISLYFKGEPLTVVYENPENLDYGEYTVASQVRDDEAKVVTVLLKRR